MPAGPFVRNFVGLNQKDSARIFNILQDHITRQENILRWRWQPGESIVGTGRLPAFRARC